MSPFIKNFISIAGFVLICVFGYYLFVLNDTASLNIEAGLMQDQIDLESREFLMKLNDIRTIDFSKDFFSDPRLQSFVDSKPSSQSYPVSRPDPFADVN